MDFTDLYLDTVSKNSTLYGKMYAENELSEFERIECREDVMNGQVAIYHAQEMLYDMIRIQETNVYGEAIGGIFITIVALVKKAILFLLKIFVGVKGMLLLLLVGVLDVAMSKKSSTVTVGGGGGGGSTSKTPKEILERLKKITMPSEKVIVEATIKTTNSLLSKDMSPSKNISYSSFLENSPVAYIDKSEFKKLEKYVSEFKNKMENSSSYGGYDLIYAAAVDTVFSYDIYMTLSLYVQNMSVMELSVYSDKAQEIVKKSADCMNGMKEISDDVAEVTKKFINSITLTSQVMASSGDSKRDIENQMKKEMELSDKNHLELLGRCRLNNPKAIYPKDLTVLNAMADAFDIKVSYAKSLSELKMSLNNVIVGNDGHLEKFDVIVNNAVYSEMISFIEELTDHTIYSNKKLDKEAIQKAVKVLTDVSKELQSLTDDLAKTSNDKQIPKERQAHINKYLSYSIASTTALFNVLKFLDVLRPNAGFENMMALLQKDVTTIVSDIILEKSLKDVGLTKEDIKSVSLEQSNDIAQSMHNQMNQLFEQQVIQENVRQFNEDSLRMQEQINQSMMMNMF